MAEKLFIISEVKPAYEDKVVRQGEHNQYQLADGRGVLWLPDDAVIPASRLRYGEAPYNFAGKVFTPQHGWDTDQISTNREYLILSPPAPADEWEKWVEEMPLATNYPNDEECLDMDRKAWLKRCPRGK